MNSPTLLRHFALSLKLQAEAAAESGNPETADDYNGKAEQLDGAAAELEALRTALTNLHRALVRARFDRPSSLEELQKARLEARRVLGARR